MIRPLVACIALLGGCSLLPADSDLLLLDRGYNIVVAPYGDEFALRVHVNELTQIGGDLKSAEFRLYVTERLQRHGVCLGGWQEELCADPAMCVRRTRSSVTVHGRCVPATSVPTPG